MSDSMTMLFVWIWYLYSLIVASLLLLKAARRPAQDGKFRAPHASNPASASVHDRARDAAGEPSKQGGCHELA